MCPKCRKMLSIGDEHAGQPMRCPYCAGMFQSPNLAPAVVAAQPAPKAPPKPAAPPPADATAPWHERSAAPAPEWPWLVGAPPTTTPLPQAGYDWQKVSPLTNALRLAPGWHMVRRGLACLPPSLLVAFATFALLVLFVQLTRPEPDTRKIAFLIAVPILVLGAAGSLFGSGLCCLVPVETQLRKLVVGSTLALCWAVLSVLIAVGLYSSLTDPGLFFKVVMGLAYVAFVVLFLGSGLAFLVFLRGIARIFNNVRLAERLQWYTIFFALSPMGAVILYIIFAVMGAVLGLSDEEGRSALNAIRSTALFTLGAVVLAGFLLMLREVRSTIERTVVPNKT